MPPMVGLEDDHQRTHEILDVSGSGKDLTENLTAGMRHQCRSQRHEKDLENDRLREFFVREHQASNLGVARSSRAGRTRLRPLRTWRERRRNFAHSQARLSPMPPNGGGPV